MTLHRSSPWRHPLGRACFGARTWRPVRLDSIVTANTGASRANRVSYNGCPDELVAKCEHRNKRAREDVAKGYYDVKCHL